jgi:hypothetical protein
MCFWYDIITTGIDIKTKKTMSLRESTGNIAFGINGICLH